MILKMNLKVYKLNFPFLCIQRKIINKYPDVKLVIKCVDDVLVKECSRLLLANMSKYFEKLFDLESYTVEDGMRVYKLEIPFSKTSIEESIEILYETCVQSTIEVALENILTLNYFNIPNEYLENTISVIVSHIEKKKNSNGFISEYMDQFYCLLDEFQILSQSKNKNLKQRIEHLTNYQNKETIQFKEGMEIIEPSKKYMIKFSLDNELLQFSKNESNSLEFRIDNDFIVKVDVKTYSANLPEKHNLIGICVRPHNENQNLSFEECMHIESLSQKEFRRKVSLKFDIYNGFNDPIIDAPHCQVKFLSTNENLQFPTQMDSISNMRSMIGFCYPKERINNMTFVIVNIEYLV